MAMSTVLAIHITGGVIAILTGAVAIWSRKGERAHRAFGTIFIVSMLIMTSTATYMAIQLGQMGKHLCRAARALPGRHGSAGRARFAP